MFEVQHSKNNMDLQQRKLTKAEWNSIEVPVSSDEKRIIDLIKSGYNNIQIKRNYTMSLLQYLKISHSDAIDAYVFTQYLQKDIKALSKKYNFGFTDVVSKKSMKKKDMIRFSNTDRQLEANKDNLFEYILIAHLKKMCKYHSKESTKWVHHYYTITTLMSYNVELSNKCLRKVIDGLMNTFTDFVDITTLVSMGYETIECNAQLLRYSDEALYEHQKKLFTMCKKPDPKLILYIAPTGTGKTLSPLGLSEGHRVIFVCAARHVGLALAKAAISVQKKVAFAFGCGCTEDIRLHYYAVAECIRNRRTGNIAKVDNSVGDKVEIMISDIRSYEYAMLYMKAFNKEEDIILYWDEPTITMDYEEHEFHDIIKKNWSRNLIPNIVLSSATLPQKDEIRETIMDFKSKFANSEVHTIVSHDCKKTIPLINKNGFVEMPHFMFEDYDKILQVVAHCKKYKTLLRYIDLKESINFIIYVNKCGYFKSSRYSLTRNFPSPDSVTMENIKIYYLEVLENLKPDKWSEIYKHMMETRQQKQKSNIRVVTEDSHTLTDGPTIFLADNVGNVAKVCIQSAKIPDVVAQDIMKAIQFNSVINSKIAAWEKDFEDGTKEDEEKEKKMSDGRVKPEMQTLMKNIEDLRTRVKSVSLSGMFVPNTKEHIQRWTSGELTNKPFTCDISEYVVEQIMLIDDIADDWKMLLLMGIGVFASHDSARYTEVMKTLAQTQKLYLIIASSDFIYGTNYQFCHGYISKDLSDMSQEKCIQAMGRVGRNKLQQDYSIRFRDDELIRKLFQTQENKPEVRNMNRLFNSD
jgi:hypothetical protein